MAKPHEVGEAATDEIQEEAPVLNAHEVSLILESEAQIPPDEGEPAYVHDASIGVRHGVLSGIVLWALFLGLLAIAR